MSIAKNFFYNVLYQILVMILPLITAPYVARVLGPELIGVYSYTHSIAYYFVLFAQLGLSVYGNRTIAIVRDDAKKLSETFFSIYRLQIVIASASCMIYLVYTTFLAKEYNLFLYLQFLYVLSGLFDISWFYFGIEKFKLTTMRSALIKVLTVVCVLLFVKEKTDLWLYIVIMAGGVLIGQLTLWFRLFKYVQYTSQSFGKCFQHFKPILILFLPTIATSLYRVMDKIMLGSMDDMAQLGYYENSEKFIAISMGVINALGAVMIPKMSNLISNGDEETVQKYMIWSMEGIFILSAPIAFGLFSIAEILAVIFYGVDFKACGTIIEILSLSLLCSTWANVLRTQYLIPKKKDKEYIISMFYGAGINIVVNLLLIPLLGARGAAVGTVMAEVAVAGAHTFFVRKKLPLFTFGKMIVPYFLFGGLMSVIVSWVDQFTGVSVSGLLIEIVAGGVVYVTVVLIYLFCSKGQYYHFIKGIFEKNRNR